jgi:hypothetical protein
MGGPPAWGLEEVLTTPHRKNVSCYKFLQGKPRTRTDNLVRHKQRKRNLRFKIDLQEVGCGGIDWIQLAQDGDRWREIVNVVMNWYVIPTR